MGDKTREIFTEDQLSVSSLLTNFFREQLPYTKHFGYYNTI